jgi:hypothetical protein
MDLKFFTEHSPLMNDSNLDKLHQLVFQDEGAKYFAVLMNRLSCLTTGFYFFTKNEQGSGIHVIDGYMPFGERRVDLELSFHWDEDGTNPLKLKLSFNEQDFNLNLKTSLLFNQEDLDETILLFKKKCFEF